MTDAWRIAMRAPGGPEVLVREAIPLPRPGAGQARVRHAAIGLNFIDTYHRSGLYPLPAGTGPGSEVAGVVEAVGDGVTSVRPGDRVGWLPRGGGYATHSLADAATLIPLPDDIDDPLAAAALLKGLTAWMLVERCARVEAGQAVLVHAAAGGVGQILVQWLKAVGATVIAHAGSAEKAAVAAALGADHALHGPFETLATSVRDLTGGRGVAAVLDGVGAASWSASLASAARLGMIVSYGNASGPVPPVRLLDLSTAGSLFVTRPTLFDHIADPDARRTGTERLFDMLRTGAVRVTIGQRFPLAEAAEAHRALEARETRGSTILIP